MSTVGGTLRQSRDLVCIINEMTLDENNFPAAGLGIRSLQLLGTRPVAGETLEKLSAKTWK